MKALLRFAQHIDRLNRSIGQVCAWLTLVMVLVGAFNALARYLGRSLGVELSSNAYIETQWYLFGALFLLGAADVLREDGHVRVDVFYARLPQRKREALDMAGCILLVVPFCIFGLWMSLPSVANSWAVLENSPDPGGLPRYPIKTLLPVSFVLLGLQGLSNAIKHSAVLKRSAKDRSRG